MPPVRKRNFREGITTGWCFAILALSLSSMLRRPHLSVACAANPLERCSPIVRSNMIEAVVTEHVNATADRCPDALSGSRQLGAHLSDDDPRRAGRSQGRRPWSRLI